MTSLINNIYGELCELNESFKEDNFRVRFNEHRHKIFLHKKNNKIELHLENENQIKIKYTNGHKLKTSTICIASATLPETALLFEKAILL